ATWTLGAGQIGSPAYIQSYTHLGLPMRPNASELSKAAWLNKQRGRTAPKLSEPLRSTICLTATLSTLPGRLAHAADDASVARHGDGPGAVRRRTRRRRSRAHGPRRSARSRDDLRGWRLGSRWHPQGRRSGGRRSRVHARVLRARPPVAPAPRAFGVG